MKWFLNLSTRAKLFWGFGLMVLLLVAVAVTAYDGIATIRESQRRLYEVGFADAVDISVLRAKSNGARMETLEMMLTPRRPEQEALRRDIQNRTRTSDEIVRGLQQRNRGDAEFLRQLGEFDQLRKVYEEIRDEKLVPLILQGKLDEAQTLGVGPQGEQHDRMHDILRRLDEAAIEDARTRLAVSDRKAGESVRFLFGVGLMAVVLAAATVLLLTRIIAGPLLEISRVAERVAARDLTVNVSTDGRTDEVGLLALTFRKMVENLRSVTRDIGEGVNVLGSAASEILASTTQVAAGASETASAVSETTSTVEEVKQTAQVSSQKAKYVSETAQKSAQVSQGGRKAVDEAIKGMNRIREQVEAIAESIVRLSEQSQAIGEIISTVNDLADQSNLLAVNAAIEASKAGEQGKGFAVVAQEVKSLAEQSKQATAQVRSILGDIQKATSAAVMATEQGSKAVEAGVRQTAQAGEAVQTLTESIAEAAQAATQIAASSQQQLAGMDQVALAMENIKQASAQNVASTKQAEAAAQNMHQLGLKLKELVSQYRV
jgi:methyl-accepting chemotaxis protein